jgi:hypothetical protein
MFLEKNGQKPVLALIKKPFFPGYAGHGVKADGDFQFTNRPLSLNPWLPSPSLCLVIMVLVKSAEFF